MEFTAKEQRFIQRAEGSRSGQSRTMAVTALVLGLLAGFGWIVNGVMEAVGGGAGGGTHVGLGGLFVGFFLILYAFTDTKETAYSVVRKLRSRQEESRKEEP